MTKNIDDADEVQADFEDFWEDIVCPNGEWDLEQVKRELFDYHVLLQEVPKVYYHMSDGRISKPNTAASVVISVHDDLYHRHRRCHWAG